MNRCNDEYLNWSPSRPSAASLLAANEGRLMMRPRSQSTGNLENLAIVEGGAQSSDPGMTHRRHSESSSVVPSITRSRAGTRGQFRRRPRPHREQNEFLVSLLDQALEIGEAMKRLIDEESSHAGQHEGPDDKGKDKNKNDDSEKKGPSK